MAGNPSDRKPFTYRHNSLFEQQKLIAFERGHNGEVGAQGWVFPWLLLLPPNASTVIDLGAPSFISKVSMRNTNVLASPQKLQLSFSDNKDGPWTDAYCLEHAQCNRLGLAAPPNNDVEGIESDANETFYLFGDRTNDQGPRWGLKKQVEVDEQDMSMMANRGKITPYGARFCVARYWKVTVVNSNGLHYVGTQYMAFFGQSKPLAAPGHVEVHVAQHDGHDCFKVTWKALPEHEEASGYTVVAFAHDIGACSGGFVTECSGGATSCYVTDLSPTCPYVFVVYATRGEQLGVPSEPTKAAAIDTEGWVRLSSVTLSASSDALLDNAAAETADAVPTQAQETNGAGDAGSLAAAVLRTGSNGRGANQGSGATTGLCAESSKLQALVREERAKRRRALSTRQYRQEFDSHLRDMLAGDFAACDQVNAASQVTAFISSTFADTTAERNFFMQFAYPELNRFCQSLGLTFNTVDLRWGVRNESTDDHMTIDICLGELQRCMSSSTAASFVFFAGERYGWRALPNRVAATELETIVGLMPPGAAKDAVGHWYLRDENRNPPVYILQSISSMKGKLGVELDDFWGSRDAPGAQTVMQDGIRAALRAAGSDIPDDIRRNWMISVTEREVLDGLFGWDGDDVELQAMVLMRSIDGLEAAAQGGVDEARVYYTTEDEDRSLLMELRERVKQATPTSSMREFTVPWHDTGISSTTHAEYVREVAAAFVHDMEERIQVGLNKRRLLVGAEKEAFQHSSFALARARSFYGRGAVLAKLRALQALERGGGVRCVHGKSGTGKTSAMSAMAVEAGSARQYHTVVFRACGTSVASSSAMSLMASICEQLEQRYGLQSSQPKVEFDEQATHFLRCLQQATADWRLLLVLDSLDQLSDIDQARSQPWRWLPSPDTIPHTTIVVSTLPEPMYGVLPALLPRLAADDAAEIGPLGNAADAFGILEEWLAGNGRRLQRQEQREAVKLALDRSETITMLHLKLVFDQLMRWKSYTAPSALATTVPGLIEDIYTRLEHFHGAKLVREVMALLNASRSGLSEKNLLDLISCDDNVLGKFGENGAVLQYHQPPARRLPPLVFSRLRRDLEDYMVERGANGVAVLNLYHRQFIEVSMKRYPPEGRAERLASFFAGDLAGEFPDRLIEPNPLYFVREGARSTAKVPNLQALHELPHALAASKQMTRLADLLCSPDFIEAAFEGGASFASDLLAHYRAAVRVRDIPQAEILPWFFRFASRWFHTLCLDPALLPGLAANTPQKNPLAIAMKQRMAEGTEARAWLEWQHPPEQLDPCVIKKVFPSPVTACRWARGSSSGTRTQLAACVGTSCVVIDTASNQLVASFSQHTDLVLDCDFSPNAAQVLSVGRAGEALIWNASSGASVRKLRVPSGWVTACVWGQRVLLTGTASGLVLLWHPDSGSLLGALEGHCGPLSSCALAPDADAMSAVTCSLDSTAIVWNLRTLEPVARLESDKAAANCVAWAPNGRLLAVAHDRKACEIWSQGRGGGALGWEISKVLEGHTSEVWSCSFAPDSLQVVTVGADRKGRIFSVRTGEQLCTLGGHAQWVWGCDWMGPNIATCSMDKSVIVWDRAYVNEGDGGGQTSPLVGLQVSSSGEIHTLSKELIWTRMDPGSLGVLSVSDAPTGAKVGQAGHACLSPAADRWVYPHYDTSYVVHWPDRVHTVSISGFGKFCHSRVIWNPGNPAQVLSGTHGGRVMLVSDADSGRVLHGSHSSPGWVEDLFWTPDGRMAVVGGQQATSVLDMQTEQAVSLPIPMYAACIDGSQRRVAGLTMTGQAYDRHATGGVVVSIDQESEPLTLQDPFKELSFSRERLCRWMCADSLVAFTSSTASPFGCPQVIVFDATEGHVVCRFCSPYSEDFERMEAMRAEDGLDSMLVLADANGRIFVLRLRSSDS